MQALNYLEFIFKKKYFGIVIINLIATFLFSLLLTFYKNADFINLNYSLWLFLSCGFLGSFSSFSTFIKDLFIIIKERKWRDIFIFLSYSLIGGIFFGFLGFYIANT